MSEKIPGGCIHPSEVVWKLHNSRWIAIAKFDFQGKHNRFRHELSSLEDRLSLVKPGAHTLLLVVRSKECLEGDSLKLKSSSQWLVHAL